jgi:glyoxylase-like metal-dependent hydrolase (beta-lactamase superfamily II)
MTRKVARKSSSKSKSGATAAAKAGLADPIVAPGSPAKVRARVRMYRHGLGDCFLLTLPRKKKLPFQMLIDCGVPVGNSAAMTRMIEHIRDTLRNGNSASKARLDVVVATHEHKDHLSAV